eukprot:scaffold178237_cov19-Prasinocladus_malaysianus.AAC.1
MAKSPNLLHIASCQTSDREKETRDHSRLRRNSDRDEFPTLSAIAGSLHLGWERAGMHTVDICCASEETMAKGLGMLAGLR